MCGITNARSEKTNKRQANRRLSVRLRSTVARTLPVTADTHPVWPGLREVSDPWVMAKDG